jgi:hypothetical protein
MAGFRQRAQDWWNRQQFDTEHVNYRTSSAREISKTHITQNEFASEFEAELAEPVKDIPFTVYPTATINPARPRTKAAGYDRETETLRIMFREGAVYDYHDVTANEWKDIKRVVSTGKFINRRLDAKDYTRIR